MAGPKRQIPSLVIFSPCSYLWGYVNRIADSSVVAIPTGGEVTGEPCP